MKKKKKSMLLPLVVSIVVFNFLLNRIEINSNIINFMLSSSNSHFASKEDEGFSSIFLDLIGIELDNPVSILESNVVFNENKEPMFTYMNNQNIVSNPVVYIYNTHPTEYYVDDYLTEYNLRPGVLTASYVLQEQLNSMGINTIVEEKNVYNYLLENDLDYNSSYDVSRLYLEEAIKEYPSLELIIDIHRDAIPRDSSYVEIDGKPYARIMFVMNEAYENYDNSTSFNNLIDSNYPGLSRGIYEREYHFNQDLNTNIFLLEVGSDKNSYEEVLNTVEAFSLMIKEYLNEG